MVKTKSIIEIKKEERIYEFVCAPDSPLGEAYDVLTQMCAYVADRIKENQPKPETTCAECKE